MSILINRNVLSKGWKKYYIMHKDRKVAVIRENGDCTVYFPSFMPYNLYFESPEDGDLDTRLGNLNNFYHWCSSRVLTLDRKYAKEILNSIGASQANTDRHWCNWGFCVDNKTNKLVKLHPLMDFNKAFLSYDTIDGARCQTVQGSISQKDAAVYAVGKIGLNQISEVREEWFGSEEIKDMFFRRLSILKEYTEKKENCDK